MACLYRLRYWTVEITGTATDAGAVAAREVCNRSKKWTVPVNPSSSEDFCNTDDDE